MTAARSILGAQSAARVLDDTRISERAIERAHFAGKKGSVKNRAAGPSRWRRLASLAAQAEYIPSHVKHCANNPYRVGRWTLATWRRDAPTRQLRTAYTCGSYRCPSPECQRAAAHRDFAKILEGVRSVGNFGWNYLVLTIDQHSTLNTRSGGKRWKNEQEAFRELSRMSRNFLARLRRWFVSKGWRSFENKWVATVEVQKNGWPHLNLMLHSPELAEWLDENPSELDESPNALRGPLREHAIGCDWGAVGFAAPSANAEALAGYLVQVGSGQERTVGEISKLTQVPTNARMKLRRFRSGKGFLRHRIRDGAWTGIMLRRKQVMGLLAVEPLMKPEQVRQAPEQVESYLEGARHAIREELRQTKREAEGAKEAFVAGELAPEPTGPPRIYVVPGGLAGFACEVMSG